MIHGLILLPWQPSTPTGERRSNASKDRSIPIVMYDHTSNNESDRISRICSKKASTKFAGQKILTVRVRVFQLLDTDWIFEQPSS